MEYLYLIYVFLLDSLSLDKIFEIFLLKLNQWRSDCIVFHLIIFLFY